jgi:hypothetical protein
MQVVAMKVVETTATTTSSSQLVDMHDLCIWDYKFVSEGTSFVYVAAKCNGGTKSAKSHHWRPLHSVPCGGVWREEQVRTGPIPRKCMHNMPRPTDESRDGRGAWGGAIRLFHAPTLNEFGRVFRMSIAPMLRMWLFSLWTLWQVRWRTPPRQQGRGKPAFGGDMKCAKWSASSSTAVLQPR